MSAGPATVTSQSRSRRLVSPVTFEKEREKAEVLQNPEVQRENGHGLESSSEAFTNSTASTISMPRVDSCIIGKETLEQRERFTVSKIVRYFVDIAHGRYAP